MPFGNLSNSLGGHCSSKLEQPPADDANSNNKNRSRQNAPNTEGSGEIYLQRKLIMKSRSRKRVTPPGAPPSLRLGHGVSVTKGLYAGIRDTVRSKA